MLTASCDTLTEDTLFSDLTFSDLAQPDNVVTVEKACIGYGYLAREAGVDQMCIRDRFSIEKTAWPVPSFTRVIPMSRRC